MLRLVVLPRSLTGTAPHARDLAGSPVLTIGAGRVASIASTPNPARATRTAFTSLPTTTPLRKRVAVVLTAACPTGATASGASVRQFDSSQLGGCLYTITPHGIRVRGGAIYVTAPVLPSRPLADCGRDTTVYPIRPAANIHRIPAMANTKHPLDIEVEEMHQTHYVAVRVFSRDGVIDPDERMLLDLISGHYRDVADYRSREEAADSFKRNGHTRITAQRFEDAGYGLIDLEAHRNRSKVIAFPSNDKHAG